MSMTSGPTGKYQSPASARWPLIFWIIPDIVIGIVFTALLALPVFLVVAALRSQQGGSLFDTSGDLILSSPLFFGLVVAQNLAFSGVTLLRVLALASRSRAWLGLTASRPLYLIAQGLGTSFLFLLLNIGLTIVFTSLGISQNQSAQYPLNRNDLTGQILIAIAGALIAPIGEELFFRGYIHGALRDRWGSLAAIAGGAAFFALAHILSATEGLIALIVPVFLLGLLLGYLREESGSLLPGIVVHIANNTVGISLLLFCVNNPAICQLP